MIPCRWHGSLFHRKPDERRPFNYSSRRQRSWAACMADEAHEVDGLLWVAVLKDLVATWRDRCRLALRGQVGDWHLAVLVPQPLEGVVCWLWQLVLRRPGRLRF